MPAVVEATPECLQLGIKLGELMTEISLDSAASAIGVDMEKHETETIATITMQAAEEYFHPGTGIPLKTILEELYDKCQNQLPMQIYKAKDHYIVVQSMPKK
jgi:hypothetical protein